MRTRLISSVCAVILILLLGAATRSRETLLLAAPLLCYIGAARLSLPTPPEVHVHRSVSPRRLAVGGTVHVHLEIDVTPRFRAEVPLSLADQGLSRGEQGLSRAPHYLVLAEGVPPGMEGGWKAVHGLVCSAGPVTARLDYTCRPSRGIHRLSGIHLWISDPGALWPERRFVPAPARIAVFPRLRIRTSLTLRPRRTLLFGGTIPAGEGGAGLHFFDVRDYRAGDSLRHINWKASARRTKRPVINEFEPERATDVGLIVDSRRAAWSDGPHGQRRFDAAVEAAAGLTDLLLDMGNRLGLLVYGGALDWLPTGSGRLQRQRALTRLAAATVREHLVFNNLGHIPLHLFPAGSQLVIVSAVQLEDVQQLVRLVGRGYRVLVVTPILSEGAAGFRNPDSVHTGKTRTGELAHRLLDVERSVIQRRLGRHGIVIIHWSTDEPLAACLARENQRLARAYSAGRGRI